MAKAVAVLIGVLVAATLALGGGPCRVQDTVYTTHVKDPKSGKAQPVHLWLPDGLTVARGAICQMRYNELVHRADYRRLARLRRFALLGGMLEHGGDLKYSLSAALKALAENSGHPEVEHFPMVMSGFSNGTWMAVNLAKVMPERVIAVAICAMPGLSHDPADPAHVAVFRGVPVLQVNGSNDGATHGWFPKTHAKAREMRYLWGLAHQWHVKHVYGNTNALAWPFEEEAIAARLPADADARSGPVALKPVKESDGWLGDTDTWQTNWATIRPFSEAEVRREANTWLLNEHVACVWRAFVTCRPTAEVTLASDSKPKGAVLVRAEGKFADKVTTVEFFDGRHPLGKRTVAPWEIRTDKLANSVHSVYAVVTDGAGGKSATRPVLCVEGAGIDQDREEAGAKKGR